jgi:hypothetical protein
MKNIKAILLIKFILVLAFCIGTAASDALPLVDQPTIAGSSIRSGEVLEYSVKLRGIPAGTQILEVDGKTTLDGHEVYHVKSVSKTKRLFSILYPFSNRIESFIQTESLQPLHYTKQIRDGGYKGNIDVDFDLSKKVARIVKDQKRMEINVPPGIQDELSMIYFLRSKEIEVGQKYQLPILTGVKTYKTTVVVLRTERLKTVLGTLNTIVVKAIPNNITIWLTKDTARIPVKIEASTKAGKLASKLESIH